MKKLISLFILTGVFLVGYYAGRLPDSPDLIGRLGDACAAALDVGGRVVERINDFAPPEDSRQADARAESSPPAEGDLLAPLEGYSRAEEFAGH
jgi:hypothetical protein